MTDKPLISVIMPVYNRTQFLPQAAASVLRQSYPNVELIIVDDGSSVNMNDVVKQFSPSDKIVFVNKPHSGLSDTLNTGISCSRGDYLAFLDDDDLWDQHMLSKAFSAIQEEGTSLSVVGYRYFTDGNVDHPSGPFHFFNNKERLVTELTLRSPFPVNTILIKKEIIKTVGPFRADMPVVMDWDLCLRIMASGFTPAFVNEGLAWIRIHGENMCRNDALMQRGRLQVLRNAEDYLTPAQKKECHLERKIAIRCLITGWYVAIFESKKAGRGIIFSAREKIPVFLFPGLLLEAITFLPANFLRTITQAFEKMVGRRNLYREFKPTS